MDELGYYDSTQEKGTVDNFKSHLIDFIQTLVVFGAIFALIFWQVAQPHRVSGSSMVPTLINGDYILTDKVSYKLGRPKHGDIIVFKNPKNESEDFVKRIMAGPGDRIKIESGLVYINSKQIPEPYLTSETTTNVRNVPQDGVELKVKDDNYFVLGDNREHSSDSREWGEITREEIIGKVIFRYWPPQSIGLIRSCCSL